MSFSDKLNKALLSEGFSKGDIVTNTVPLYLYEVDGNYKDIKGKFGVPPKHYLKSSGHKFQVMQSISKREADGSRYYELVFAQPGEKYMAVTPKGTKVLYKWFANESPDKYFEFVR